MKRSSRFTSLEKRIDRLSRQVRAMGTKGALGLDPIPLAWVPSLRRKLLKNKPARSRNELSRQIFFDQTKVWVDSHLCIAADVKNLPKIHAMFSGKSAPTPFRSQSAFIADSSGKRHWTYPPGLAIPALWQDLLRWEQDSVYARALGLHFMILSIHPFPDANGRVARMLEYAVLKHAKEPLAQLIHPEILVHWNFKDYFSAIGASRQEQMLNPFVESFMEGYSLFAESLISG